MDLDFKYRERSEWKDRRLHEAFHKYKRAIPKSVLQKEDSCQYNDILIEFFDSINLLDVNEKLQSYTPAIENFNEYNKSPLELAILDAVEFTKELYRQTHGLDIPDFHLSFTQSRISNLREKIEENKEISVLEKKQYFDMIEIRNTSSPGEYPENSYSIQRARLEKIFNEKDLNSIDIRRGVCWKHIDFSNIYIEGENINYYRANCFDIAIYSLQRNAEIYLKQRLLASPLFERTLLDALLFSTSMQRIRTRIGLADNEILGDFEVKNRLLGNGWFYFSIRLLMWGAVGATFACADNIIWGIAAAVAVFFKTKNSRKEMIKRIEDFSFIAKPYQLFGNATEKNSFVEIQRVRKAMEEVDLRFNVFPSVAYTLLDQIRNPNEPSQSFDVAQI